MVLQKALAVFAVVPQMRQRHAFHLPRLPLKILDSIAMCGECSQCMGEGLGAGVVQDMGNAWAMGAMPLTRPSRPSPHCRTAVGGVSELLGFAIHQGRYDHLAPLGLVAPWFEFASWLQLAVWQHLKQHLVELRASRTSAQAWPRSGPVAS